MGNVQLSDVVQPLAAVGVSVEWQPGGALLCNGAVVVRKQGDEGTLVVEGPLCGDYYTVREVVYGQYHVC
jgi:cleavage and polyadenylation specificity factor subunit 2